MDPAPKRYDELPRDAVLGRPVPFACGTGEPGQGPEARQLDRARVIQCALSRVCGVCGAGLDRPVAFLGSQREVDRNSFHFPPAHAECAHRLLAEYASVASPVLGQTEPVTDWRVVTTAGFEFVRATREMVDRRPTFEPNSLLDVAVIS